MTKATAQFFSHVDDGRLDHRTAIMIQSTLKAFNGKDVSITIKEYKPTATDQQRKYWFSVVVPILGDHLGYDKDEMHAVLIEHLMPELVKVVIGLDGRESKIRPSWNDLDVSQAIDLVDRAYSFARYEHNVFIPEPS